MALPLACVPPRRFLESHRGFFIIKDADVECEGTCVDAMTRLFDAPEATHALAACREGPARHGEGDRTG